MSSNTNLYALIIVAMEIVVAMVMKRLVTVAQCLRSLKFHIYKVQY